MRNTTKNYITVKSGGVTLADRQEIEVPTHLTANQAALAEAIRIGLANGVEELSWQLSQERSLRDFTGERGNVWG